MPPFAGFIGPSYTPRSKNADVERLVNLYVEQQESEGADPRQVLFGTPGTTVRFTIPNSGVRALFTQNDRTFAVCGDGFYECTGGVPIWLGTVANDGLPATICSNGAGGNQLFIVSGGYGYIFTLTTNAFALIADPDFPNGNARAGVFIDTYFIVLTQSGIFFAISDNNQGTSWAALDRAQSSISSDLWRNITVVGRNLLLVGSQTAQVWYNSGAADFPFTPIVGVLMNQGTEAPYSLAAFDTTAYWLSSNIDGGRMVMRAEGATASRVSTHAVETALGRYSDVSDFEAWTYQDNGHAFYVLRSVRNQATWVLDASTQQWHERSWWNSVTGQDEAVRGRCHTYASNEHWVGDYQTGAVYRQGLDLFEDAGGVPLRAVRRFPHLVDEQHRVFYTRMQLDMQVGAGLTTGQGVDPKVMLRWSNDGGYQFGPEVWKNCGPIGRYETRVAWAPLGSGRSRVFEAVQTDPVMRCWTAAFLDVQAGRW